MNVSRRDAEAEQLSLFGGGAGEGVGGGEGGGAERGASAVEAEVGSAGAPERVRRVAERLPGVVRMGTSTWSFPGWAGIVYDRKRTSSELARRGLAAYVQHPSLRAVGVDRTFYSPMTEEELGEYADAAPEGFRFLVKANQACTFPTLKRRGAGGGEVEEENASFMDAGFALEASVGPAVRGLGEKLGVVLFQFPPMGRRFWGSGDEFADRLHGFLSALPSGAPIAVEIRNEELCVPRYAAAVADIEACSHCFVVHPSAASLSRQAETVRLGDQQQLVCRWMLHAGQSYMGAKGRYEPFDRLVDPDPVARRGYVELLVEALSMGKESLVVVNNKAEGSAPLSVMKLAEELVESLEEERGGGERGVGEGAGAGEGAGVGEG